MRKLIASLFVIAAMATPAAALAGNNNCQGNDNSQGHGTSHQNNDNQ